MLGVKTLAKLESDFQSNLKDKLKTMFPGIRILKTDICLQGFPDLTGLLPDGRWFTLECKKEEHAAHQPNQDYYVDECNRASFSRFIYPENEQEVLNELHETFGASRKARFSRGK